MKQHLVSVVSLFLFTSFITTAFATGNDGIVPRNKKQEIERAAKINANYKTVMESMTELIKKQTGGAFTVRHSSPIHVTEVDGSYDITVSKTDDLVLTSNEKFRENTVDVLGPLSANMMEAIRELRDSDSMTGLEATKITQVVLTTGRGVSGVNISARYNNSEKSKIILYVNVVRKVISPRSSFPIADPSELEIASLKTKLAKEMQDLIHPAPPVNDAQLVHATGFGKYQ